MRGAAARGQQARRARLAKVPLATADGKPAEGREARVVALIFGAARLGLAVDGATSFAAIGLPACDDAPPEAGRPKCRSDAGFSLLHRAFLSFMRKDGGGSLAAPTWRSQSARAAIIAAVDFCSTVAAGCALS